MVKNPYQCIYYLPYNLSYGTVFPYHLFYPLLIFSRLCSTLNNMDNSSKNSSNAENNNGHPSGTPNKEKNSPPKQLSGANNVFKKCDKNGDQFPYDEERLEATAKKLFANNGRGVKYPARENERGSVRADSLPLEVNNTQSSDSENSPTDNGEFSDGRPLRKTSSLKVNKPSSGSPPKKKVTFADSLEEVRTIDDDEFPNIPASATRDLVLPKITKPFYPEVPKFCLGICFSQPYTAFDFYKRVEEGKICLESCITDNMTITGIIRVANIGYYKTVKVRYTVNDWLTHQDIDATYLPNLNNGETDRFSFTYSVPPYFHPGCETQFAIVYDCDSGTYWDNNYQRNYLIECRVFNVDQYRNEQFELM